MLRDVTMPPCRGNDVTGWHSIARRIATPHQRGMQLRLSTAPNVASCFAQFASKLGYPLIGCAKKSSFPRRRGSSLWRVMTPGEFTANASDALRTPVAERQATSNLTGLRIRGNNVTGWHSSARRIACAYQRANCTESCLLLRPVCEQTGLPVDWSNARNTERREHWRTWLASSTQVRNALLPVRVIGALAARVGELPAAPVALASRTWIVERQVTCARTRFPPSRE